MPLVNYAAREITAKVVYYGPARSGKTTNLQFIHSAVPAEVRGPIVSLATEGDRTLFFDYLPIYLGRISGFRTRIQLYTVPGQVYYASTRRLVLQGADGVVFVADSQRHRQADNLESFRSLQQNILDQGIDPRLVPICLQYNKRDAREALPPQAIEASLNFRGLPAFEASAVAGLGVLETFQHIATLVIESLAGKLTRSAGREGGVGA
jgi:mutual gliding-motility protein MglA